MVRCRRGAREGDREGPLGSASLTVSPSLVRIRSCLLREEQPEGCPGQEWGSLLGPEPDHTSPRGVGTSAWRTPAPASGPTHRISCVDSGCTSMLSPKNTGSIRGLISSAGEFGGRAGGCRENHGHGVTQPFGPVAPAPHGSHEGLPTSSEPQLGLEACSVGSLKRPPPPAAP